MPFARKIGPKAAQDALVCPNVRLKPPQDTPKAPQDAPRTPFKTAPRRPKAPQDATRTPQKAPKTLQDTTNTPRSASRAAQTSCRPRFWTVLASILDNFGLIFGGFWLRFWIAFVIDPLAMLSSFWHPVPRACAVAGSQLCCAVETVR